MFIVFKDHKMYNIERKYILFAENHGDCLRVDEVAMRCRGGNTKARSIYYICWQIIYWIQMFVFSHVAKQGSPFCIFAFSNFTKSLRSSKSNIENLFYLNSITTRIDLLQPT